MAIITKDVVVSLLSGVFLGQLVLNNYNPFDAFIEYFLCHSYIFSPNRIVFNSNKVW